MQPFARPSLVVALLAAASLSGACFSGSSPLSESIDTDADTQLPQVPDASPRADADPSCSAWRSLRGEVQSITLLESEPLRVGRSARLRLHVWQCPGDGPGLWSYAPTLENEFLSIGTTLWRAADDCSDPQLVTRDINVQFPYQGEWTLLANESLDVDVFPAASGACGSATASACEKDCDCPQGEFCLSGDGSNGARCAQPCAFHRDCLGEGACGNANGLESICLRDQNECQADRPCPEGFDCVQNRCEPSFALNQFSRHECSCDSECDAGMRCVEGLVAGEPRSHCQAICATPSDGWCQGAHSCNANASVEESRGVCGWVGD